MVTSSRSWFSEAAVLAVLLVVVLLPTSSLGGSRAEESERRHRAECLMWSKLENKTLPLQDQGHANCTTNARCTGFDCFGIYQGKDLSFGMRVLPCRATPGVQIYGYAPQFNSKNFSHVFEHESEYKVPGELLNLSMLPGTIEATGTEVTGRLQVHIQRNPDGKSLMMGLVIKACINDNCLLAKPVFNHTDIPVPECPNHISDFSGNTKVDSVCRMSDLSSCGPNQTCVQEEVGGDIGLCECLAGFVRQDDQTCISKTDDARQASMKYSPVRKSPPPVVHKKEEKKKSPSQPAQPQVSESASGGAIAAAVISVLVVLLVVGVGGFIIFRTRLVPRLRARLTSTPYEDIVIGKQGRSESRQNVIA